MTVKITLFAKFKTPLTLHWLGKDLKMKFISENEVY